MNELDRAITAAKRDIGVGETATRRRIVLAYRQTVQRLRLDLSILQQRIYLTKRQVRCCVAGRWSDWHDLTVEDARALDAEQVVGDGACLDVEAMYRVARNCWPLAHTLEGCTA